MNASPSPSPVSAPVASMTFQSSGAAQKRTNFRPFISIAMAKTGNVAYMPIQSHRKSDTSPLKLGLCLPAMSYEEIIIMEQL